MRLATRLALAILLLAGPAFAGEEDPLARITFEEAVESEGLFNANDPWEPMNRRLYRFNARFDQFVFLPVVRGYEFVLPRALRSGVHNAFSNLNEITRFVNCVLQVRPTKAGKTFIRFALNTTAGIGGLWDHASEMGVPIQDETFAQTLGRYGLGAGPYLVIPIVGPSTLRGGAGMLGDLVARNLILPVPLYVSGVETVDTRANVPFRYGDLGSPFEYEIVRFLVFSREELRTAR